MGKKSKTKKNNFRKDRTRKQDSLSAFKRKVLSDLTNLDKYMLNLKYNLTFENRKKILDLIHERKFPGYQFTYNGIIAKSINDIGNTRYVTFVSDDNLETEIEWCLLIINKYQNLIQKYINMCYTAS